MPVILEINLTGEPRLASWLTAAPALFRAGLFGATTRAARMEADAIRADTPVRTGTMRGSIGTRITATATGARGEIYSTDAATRFVEYGTRNHGSAQRMFRRGVSASRGEVIEEFRSTVTRIITP